MIMKTFGNIPVEFGNAQEANIYLTSVPYDETSTWGKGANKGFEAFLKAAENMELYDIETDSEVYKRGIFLADAILEKSSPEAMFKATYNKTKELLETDKFLTFFGGEHSISIGVIKAFYEKYPNLTVIQLDAHADLRSEYDGTPYNHACALHAASLNTNLIQVGIRSMDISEKQYMNEAQCYFAQDIQGNKRWVKDVLEQTTGPVYITVDLDVFDPSIMPSTGTPEPGGMKWYEVLGLLKEIFYKKEVVGFDIVELAPNPENKAPDFLAAKLYYKMLSYKYLNKSI
jgi:agmatinase